MATAAALRARVRTRLEEASAGIWTDTELDECVTGALEAYALVFPKETTAGLAVAEGATSAALPADTLETRRVTLADGTVVPRRGAPARATCDEELAWEAYAGTLWFTQPLAAQTLTLWLTSAPTLADLPSADEGVVVLGGVAQALTQRAVEDFKRGVPRDETVVERARAEFELELRRRARRLRVAIAAGP
jgi:hypothetical protein